MGKRVTCVCGGGGGRVRVRVCVCVCVCVCVRACVSQRKGKHDTRRAIVISIKCKENTITARGPTRANMHAWCVCVFSVFIFIIYYVDQQIGTVQLAIWCKTPCSWLIICEVRGWTSLSQTITKMAWPSVARQTFHRLSSSHDPHNRACKCYVTAQQLA